MRWEKFNGLPVHRLPGGPRARVYALKSELEAWRSGPQQEKDDLPDRSQRRGRLPFLLGAAALLGLAGFLWKFSGGANSPAPRVVPLTSYPGVEWFPAFSPDGKQIAFSWNGPNEDNFDVYVRFVDTGEAVRLTTDAAMDISPVWSPDGRYLAFIRWQFGAPTYRHMVVPALGGAERVILEAPITPNSVFGGRPAWTRDGQWLVCSLAPSPEAPRRLVLVSPDTREMRPLTAPPEGSLGDRWPTFSPDGRTLAFLRGTPAPDRANAWLKERTSRSCCG